MKKITSFVFSLGFVFLGIAQEITWVSIEEAEKLQEKNPTKELFIDFYTNWCGWCNYLDKTTLSDPEVVELINKKYIAVKFDAEGKTPINFKGKKYEYVQTGRSGIHSFAYWILSGQRAYPSIAILDGKGNTKKLINGYLTKEEILPYLR